MTIRCWWCGTQPIDSHDVWTVGYNHPITTLYTWPTASDHEHEPVPPTPGALLDRAGRLADRLLLDL